MNILKNLRRSHAHRSGPRGSHGWARVRWLLLKRRPWRSSRLHFGLKRQNVLLRASWCSNIFPSSTSADSDPGLQNPEIRLSNVFSFSRPFTTRHKMTKNFVNADVIKLNPHFCSNSGKANKSTLLSISLRRRRFFRSNFLSNDRWIENEVSYRFKIWIDVNLKEILVKNQNLLDLTLSCLQGRMVRKVRGSQCFSLSLSTLKFDPDRLG